MAAEEWVNLDVVLKANGHPVETRMTVPANPVKPHRMLPIIHQMTNSFVDMSVRAAEADGKTISCKAGCGACCRQPVPLAEVELYQIAELVEAMPEPRRSVIKGRFADAARHFRTIKWFDKMKRCADLTANNSPDVVMKEVEKAVTVYFREGVPCPFLENESCSIHESRPVVCREYLVTSPAVNCANPDKTTVAKVDLVLRTSKMLQFFGGSGRLDHLGFLPLIRVLEIAQMFPEKYASRTGPQWMRDFFKIREGAAKGANDSPSTVRKKSKKRRNRRK